MARPKQDGLLYFSFDTDFFYADKRIKRFHSKYGNDGLIFYIYLLTEIYRNGYYISWDEESAEDAAADLNLKEGFTEQALTYLASRSLLTVSKLASSVTVITSPGIQKRYQEAVKSRKRDVYVDSEIWLLSKEDTATYIKFAQKKINPAEIRVNPAEIRVNPAETTESKVKESKINNKNNMCKADADALFEKLWKLYPVKKGKGQVSDTKKMKLLKIGYDEMAKAIGRYLSELKKDEWRRPQNGSTFFNSGYVDYLDANYVPDKKKNPKNAFCNFKQRDTDYDSIVLNRLKERLNNDSVPGSI